MTNYVCMYVIQQGRDSLSSIVKMRLRSVSVSRQRTDKAITCKKQFVPFQSIGDKY